MSPPLDRKKNEVRVKAIDNMMNDTCMSIYSPFRYRKILRIELESGLSSQIV